MLTSAPRSSPATARNSGSACTLIRRVGIASPANANVMSPLSSAKATVARLSPCRHLAVNVPLGGI
jgi:hypothetical protein